MRKISHEQSRRNSARRQRRVERQVIAERGYVNLRLDYEDVAEFTYRPGKCARGYRVVVVRKNISRMKGGHALIDEVRYFFYFTTYPADTHTPARIVELANGRCDQENIVGQLKSGINALHAPVDDLHSNWAHMLIAALAWNIKSAWAGTERIRVSHRIRVTQPSRVTSAPPPTGDGDTSWPEPKSATRKAIKRTHDATPTTCQNRHQTTANPNEDHPPATRPPPTESTSTSLV